VEADAVEFSHFRIPDFNEHKLRFITEECDLKNDSVGLLELDDKIQLLVFLTICLYPKIPYSLRNRLSNPACNDALR